MSVIVYALKLDDDKYYLGRVKKTKIAPVELLETDTKWTKTYQPQEVYKIYTGCDEYDVDKITIKYMAKHGIDNVRGGSFVRMKLSTGDVELIRRMIKTAGVCTAETAPARPAKSAAPVEEPADPMVDYATD
jgi:hypothetical protein